MDASTGGGSAAGRVIRQERGQRRLAWLFAACGAAQVALQGTNIVTSSEAGRFAYPMIAIGLLMMAVGLVQVATGRVALTIGPDRLVVRPGVRTIDVRRDEVDDVRSSTRGRPRWGEHVVLHHTRGTTPLPLLEVPPAQLIPLLRDWAGLDAPSDQAPSSGGSTSTG